MDYVYPRHKKLKGGITVYLLVADYKTDHVMFRALAHKDETVAAFESIIIERGWHKLHHTTHVVSDGEPKLHAEIAIACRRMGLSHSTSVPNQPQSNRAGGNIVRNLRWKVDCALAAASQHGTTINGSFEAIAMELAVRVHNMLSNSRDPENRSPHELSFALQPTYNLAPFGSACYMAIGSTARRAHIARGGKAGHNRAEAGLWIGFRDNHHRIVTTRGTGRCGPVFIDLAAPLGVFPGQLPSVTHKPVMPPVLTTAAAQQSSATDELAAATVRMLCANDAACKLVAGPKRSRTPYIQARCDAVAGTTLHEALQRNFLNAQGESRAYRRSDADYDIQHGFLRVELAPPAVSAGDVTLEGVNNAHVAMMLALCDEPHPAAHALNSAEQTKQAQQKMNIAAQKGLSWKKYVHPDHPDRPAVIRSWDKEIAGIKALGVMDEVLPGTPDYAIAIIEAIQGKALLDLRRGGDFKSRFVYRGDKEDVAKTDGPGFIYFASVASLPAIRLVLLRPGRYNLLPGETEEDYLEISSCDVLQAFCQSDPFNDGKRRFVKIKSPIDGITRYYELKKPLYGARSAPKRWSDTFASWAQLPFEQNGPNFTRGMNQPSIFSRKATSTHGALTLVLWVDDCLLIGKRRDHLEFYRRLNLRFETKPPKWLSTGSTLDHVGMYIYQCENYTWLHMRPYIQNMAKILAMEGCKPMYVPMTKNITDFKQISDVKKSWFQTALGQTGWLALTMRVDIAHTQSRIAQYTASPNQGAYDALVTLVRYVITTQNLAIRQPLRGETTWSFWSDSDFAGNPEPGNRRRSQMAELAMWFEAPIQWAARVTTVQVDFASATLPAGFDSSAPPVTAHPAIPEEHVAQSSTEAETYALALCANGLLGLSYACDEAGIDFPRPAVVNVDNMAAIAFSQAAGGTGRTRMRHIDVRAEWLQVLRNSGLVTTQHVTTREQLADIGTKIHDQETFVRLRDKLLHWFPY